MAKCYVLLLGGIGSGKSSVGRLLAARDAAVFDADLVGHQVLETEEVKRDLETEWPSVLHNDRIDRSLLAAVVFADENQLQKLESITHPRIKKRLAELVSESEHDTVVVEMPVLRDLVDGEWSRVVVDAPDAIRLDRLLARGVERHDAIARMRSQPSRLQYMQVADFVIDNSGDECALGAQVDVLLSALPELCRRADVSEVIDGDSLSDSATTRTVKPWTRNQ